MTKRKHISLFILIGLFFTQPVIEAFSASPYPPSPIIQGVTFDPATIMRKAHGSDNWAVTWGPDNNIYTTWGDGGGFGGSDAGMGVARIEGPPENFTGINLWSVPRGYTGGKSEGILSVEGVLYLWVGPGSNSQPWTETWLQWSNDLGQTWQSSAIFFTLPDGFSKPTFLNFGQDYAGSKDDYVYIYGLDASAGTNIKPTKLSLARVHKSGIKNRSMYEFYKGLDSGGNPIWTNNVAQRQSVFTDSQGGIADSPSVIYNPALNRYIMSKTFNSNQTYPAGGLGIFDAPEPWGPWTTVEYTENWMGSTTMYFNTFPTKWISNDGLTMWMIYTGYGNVAQDAYQHIKAQLTLVGNENTPPAPPKNLKVNPQ